MCIPQFYTLCNQNANVSRLESNKNYYFLFRCRKNKKFKKKIDFTIIKLHTGPLKTKVVKKKC